MRRYYVIGSIIAVVLAILIFVGIAIYCYAALGKMKSQAKDFAEDTIVLRYYLSDDYDNAEIVYIRITDKNNYSISRIPTKEGYAFAGLCDGKDPTGATVYVDLTGRGIRPLSRDIILYPIFTESL